MILDESSVDKHLRTGDEEAAKVALVEFAPAVPAKGDRALEEDDLAVAGFDADVQERVDAGDGCPPWVGLVCHRVGDSLGGSFFLLFEDGLEQAFLAAEVVVEGAAAEAGSPFSQSREERAQPAPISRCVPKPVRITRLGIFVDLAGQRTFTPTWRPATHAEPPAWQ